MQTLLGQIFSRMAWHVPFAIDSVPFVGLDMSFDFHFPTLTKPLLKGRVLEQVFGLVRPPSPSPHFQQFELHMFDDLSAKLSIVK